jgi:TorA maturation chaperone TorD
MAMGLGHGVQLGPEVGAADCVRIYDLLAGVFCAAPMVESVRAVSQMALTLGVSCPEGLSLGELEREFMDLFVVPNPRYVAPYESVYRDRWVLPPGPGKESAEQVAGRLLMGESTLQVRQAYLQAGVLPKEGLPDHIGNELQFMAYVWGRAAEAPAAEARAWAELREEFRREHLLQWIGQLRERVVERERLGYYGVALQVAEAVIREDSD